MKARRIDLRAFNNGSLQKWRLSYQRLRKKLLIGCAKSAGQGYLGRRWGWEGVDRRGVVVRGGARL